MASPRSDGWWKKRKAKARQAPAVHGRARAGGPAVPAEISWHALAEDEVREKIETSQEGLTEAEAALRLREFGRNLLPGKPPPTVPAIFLHQFLSPLIYILLAAAAVSASLRDARDAGFILAVVLLNAGLGAFQEWKAERSAASLQQLLRVTARVRRSGAVAEVNAEELAPGDLVYLESGARVPADLRLTAANHLTVDEALLTGESLPVEKRPAPLAADLPLADRRNMAYAGSLVAAGRGAGWVVATGARTEVGKIVRDVGGATSAKPPLVLRMERFARQISWLVLAAAGVLGAVAFAQGMPLLEVFFLAVALAVSAIPEGLPVAMTVALSIATSRMARRQVIVRKLTAVEGLGSCTCIASDKTGTLTRNQQTVTAIWLPDGQLWTPSAPLAAASQRLLRRLVRAGVLCNEASAHAGPAGPGAAGPASWRFAGDAVDVAFWQLGLAFGLTPDAVARETTTLAELPYESERAFAARYVRDGGRSHVVVKGAPEVVLPRCHGMRGAAGPEPLHSAAVEAALAALTGDGHRVIAIAEAAAKWEPAAPEAAAPALAADDLPPLQLLGLAGLLDPPRPEVKAAVAKCRQAGVEVLMVTGDHPRTALAIARELGIARAGESPVTGPQLAAIGSPEVPQFLDTVRQARVFARVSPAQKLDIVDALGRLGHFVAVTGDGANDAPALRRANIGVAMGSGADVAKDTAAIIIADDNFASIEAGIEEGRFAYDNVRKVIYLLVATGAAEVLLFALALLTGLPLPLTPVQLLWLNLVTNGIQDVALAFEGGEAGAIRRPPRPPSEGIFNRLMIQETVVAGATVGLVAYFSLYFFAGLGIMQARNHLLLLMVLLENFHVFNCRSECVSAFRVPVRRNWFLVVGVAIAQGIHLFAMHFPPFQRQLQVAPISLGHWALTLLAAASILAVMEVFKWRRSRAPAPGG